jgi:hypothetical protein
MTDRPPLLRRAYWIAFAVCAIAATVPLLLTRTPPMVDLPQHMAQVAIWKHFDDPCQHFHETFRLTFATPYLTAYAAARAIAAFVSVTTAIKVTVWLSVMLLPLSLRLLFTRGGGDEWLSLLGFPLAYGYAFYWGFFNFLLAIPIGIAAIALLFDRRPRDVTRALLMVLLVFTHGLVFGFCAVVTLAVAVVRRSARPLLALVPAVLVIAGYLVSLRQAAPSTFGEWTWALSLWRFVDFSSLLFANSWEPWGFPLVVAIAIAIAVTRPRVTRDRARWTFFAISAVAYLIAPSGALANAYMFPRFAIFLAISALFLFDEPRRGIAVSRAILIAVVVGWMAVLAVRFHRFDQEARSFDPIRNAVPATRRVLLFEMRPESEHVPGLQYRHYGALLQVTKGGLAAWSFAAWPPQIVRYLPGREPAIHSQPWPIGGIDWPGVLQYDYIMVRGSDPRLWLFRNAPVPLTMRLRSGEWWLFETPRAHTPQPTCPPLNE